MANEQYLRKVIVNVIPQTGSGISINGSTSNSQDIRINFKCSKTNDSDPNEATIEMYNLSQTTRNLLAARNTVINLTIGYLGLTNAGKANTLLAGNPGIGTVFIGNVVKTKNEKKKKKDDLGISTKLENTDLITTVKIGDGDNQYRNAYLDKGYPANTQLQTVLTDLANSLGLNMGPMIDIPRQVYSQGFAVTGLTRDQLDQICSNYELEWSIQNQAVQIIPKTVTDSSSAIVVNPKSGLIGPPNPTSYGVEFTTLCDHRMIPGRRVVVTSRFLNGGIPQEYKIRKVIHKGSNWDSNYFSEVQATVPVVYS